MSKDKLPEPWLGFLNEIDRNVSHQTTLFCLGGFVVTTIYGSDRSTSDLDALTLVGGTTELASFAGENSKLHKKHKVYLDPVGIVTMPENFESRIFEIFAGQFKWIRLFALDPYDLALAKIERNIARDRDDVKFLARTIPFDLDVLKSRYHDELRVYLGNPKREDLTLKLWIEMISEERSNSK